MSDCNHDLAERETAVADGMCPLCAAACIRELEAAIEEPNAVVAEAIQRAEKAEAERDSVIKDSIKAALAWKAENDVACNAIEARAERAEALLLACQCPRPANGAPDVLTVKECLGRGECGCDLGDAIKEPR